MNYKLLADTAMLAGELMLVSGGETYRVEDTMRRILNTSHLETTEVIVISTAIILTLDDKSIDTISITKRAGEKSTNLGNICEVNAISRDYCGGKITLEEAYERLKQVSSTVNYSSKMVYPCTMITVGFFTLLLGGTWLDSLIAVLCGTSLFLCKLPFKKRPMISFVYNLTAVAVGAFMAALLQTALHLELNMETVVTGVAMPLLPGTAITNAIRDTLQGDYISGAGRIVEAFVVAISIGVGIGFGLYLGKVVTGIL